MIKNFKIIGDLSDNAVADIDIDKSPLEIFKQLDLKINNGKRLIGVQIGGALGNIAFGSEMLEPIKNKLDENSVNYLMFISDLFCPVDYLRFLSRFLIREIRIESNEARYLNTCIEDVTIKDTRNNSIKKIKDALDSLGNTYAEKRIVYLYEQIFARFNDIILEHINDKYCKTGVCRTLFMAQCINACPAQVHIPGYVALMKKGHIENAYRLMRKTNPLSLICGKICAKPCEDRCRRKEIEATVGVRALQKYIGIQALSNGKFIEDKLQSNGKTIAIIGAGPAGLTAAYFLQRSGYQVNIYEELSKAGGMLWSRIPSYRMPYKDLELEIQTIINLGVKIHYNCSVGKDITIQKLQKIHSALIVATGAKLGREIKELKGENTLTALNFLKEARLYQNQKFEKNIVILGGGDVAIDSARTAVRLGAKSVTLVSLEAFDDLPASKEEVEFAIKENVKFENGFSIKEFKDKKIKLVKCYAVTDLDGKFHPILGDEIIEEIDTELLILAIGQYPDLDFLDDTIEKERGLIKVDKNTFKTSNEKIYAIGDVIENGIAIKAIAEGKKVAKAIDKDLGGEGLYLGEEISIPEEKLSITTWDDKICEETIISKENLVGDFSEIVREFNDKEAFYEANRCMRCDRNSLQPLWIRPKNNI